MACMEVETLRDCSTGFKAGEHSSSLLLSANAVDSLSWSWTSSVDGL